jgi:hypothetical protein
MEDAFIQNALAYAAQHQLRLAERLGFGIHGIISKRIARASHISANAGCTNGCGAPVFPTFWVSMYLN